jgi:hypothetical protein
MTSLALALAIIIVVLAVLVILENQFELGPVKVKQRRK